VTGASGFLGGITVRELRDHGFEVFASGRNVAALERVADAEHRVVCDLAELPDQSLRVDAVVHCAALSTPWGAWRDFATANVAGTRSVVEFMKRAGARRLVHVSSPSVYAGRRDRLGIREDEVDESNRLNGYIRSKIAAERLLQDARAAGEIRELVIVRPRGLVGVGDPSLVPRLLDVHRRIGVPLFDGGRATVDVTAVENVALALRLALTRGDAAGGVYNITNDDPRPFRALVETLVRGMGDEPRLRPMNRDVMWGVAAALERVCAALPGRPEPPLTRYTLSTIAYSQTLDIGKAKAELGYAPRVGLDDALANVITRLRENR